MDPRGAWPFRLEYHSLHEDRELVSRAQWYELSKIIRTRDEDQCRSHAQKVFKKDHDILTNPDRFMERPKEERNRAIEEMKVELGRSLRRRAAPRFRRPQLPEAAPLPTILEISEENRSSKVNERRAVKSKEKEPHWMSQLSYNFGLNG
jgi:hypothetical protein